MRIVGGRLGGRRLEGPSSSAIRPTSDRLRESLFNILEHGRMFAHGRMFEHGQVFEHGQAGIAGARVIDLFAGTGALALEALSRGARFALFVDDGAEARALIRANIEALGLGGETRIFRRDARKLGQAPPGAPFDLAFLDPPYGRGLAEPALASLRDGGWLAPGALVVVEEAAAAAIEVPAGFARLDARGFGDTQVLFLRACDPTGDA